MSYVSLSKLSRRKFLAFSTGALASAHGTSMPLLAQASKGSGTAGGNKDKARAKSRPNILYIFTDQERFFSRLPAAYPLPGHQRLATSGTRFLNHYIATTMCTSSRSVMLTGLQTIDNGMFENLDAPFVSNLSTSVPTYGHMLRKAGYYTAYKGKWHLNRDFENPGPGVDLNAEMEKYGFSDFHSPGDKHAHALGGYRFDQQIGANAIAWLRQTGRTLTEQDKPWSLTVSLINPHDIMYFNADASGEQIQDNGKLLMHAERAPEHSWYRNKWNHPLPASLRQPLDEVGRPKAHNEFSKAWGYCLGNIPLKNANWERFSDFYLNSIRSVDLQLDLILAELDNLGLSDNTIVIFTADHGEMGGSHGLRGKGPFAYSESTHVPMYVVHPDVSGGSSCQALTSHMDLVPSILDFAGISPTEIQGLAGRDLPGKSVAPALNNPAKAGIHAIRPASLFVYSGIATNDSELIRFISEAKANGKNPKQAIQESGYKPNLKNRGSLRSVFDGTHKFTRYFAPIERNAPKSLDSLFADNDVELFSLKDDPHELKNLAIDRTKNASLLQTMNDKLEAMIAAEMGKDDGREMPKWDGVEWSIHRMDL